MIILLKKYELINHMPILIIDNHTKHLEELKSHFKDVKILDFRKLKDANPEKYDSIILSGGSSLSVKNHAKDYAKEIELIRTTKKPLLGICLGFELINYAFGEKLKMLENKENGTKDIEIISKDKIFKSMPKTFEVYESHNWIVEKNNYLVPLAKSKKGIEAVKHPEKDIYGIQFHPEVFVKNNFAKLVFKNFLNIKK